MPSVNIGIQHDCFGRTSPYMVFDRGGQGQDLVIGVKSIMVASAL